MPNMRKPNYRLSTDEVERLVKEEMEKRRKLRIIQVREQAKAHAALIRNKVRSEKERLLQQFANEVKNDLEAEKAEKIRKLEQKYDNTLRTVGQGHREVHEQGDGQNIAAQKLRQQQANRNVAEDRFTAAAKKHDRDKAMQEWEESRRIRHRKLALEVEKDRAAVVAALPPPPPDISAELEKIQKKAIPMTDMKAFATTHFHIPDFQVIKAGPEEQIIDAKAVAQESDLRLKQDLAEKKRSHHEQIERARIRGNEALQKEMLKHDLGDMLKDLSLLQRKDRKRRQGLVLDVPKQVFIPPERCLEERADREIEMERKFEDIYLKQHKAGSGSTQVLSELPSSAQESSELSTTLESAPIPAIPIDKEINPALRDVTNLARPATGREPDTVLKQLLDKIKEQRNNAMVGQRLPVTMATSGSGKSVSDGDTQSVVSAGSRASWKKTENIELDNGSDDYPDTQLPEGKDKAETGFAKTSSSGLDDVNLAKTNVMIEELQQRIKTIEEQKLQLSQQLQSQTEFYKKFQQLQQQQKLLPPHLTSPHSSKDGDLSLQEVSLTSSQKDGFNLSDSRGSKRSPTHQGHAGPTADESPQVDLPSAVSNLRPVFGILKGPKNPSYELLTSNGFLPLPDMGQTESSDPGLVPPAGGLQGKATSSDCHPQRFEEDHDAGKLEDRNKDKTNSRGARRMIDFKDVQSNSAVSFGKPQVLGDHPSHGASLRTDLDGSRDRHLLGDSGSALSDEDNLIGKRMKSYQLRAQNIQWNLDEDTLAKVREYQNHLLKTHEERKQFLTDVRTDIERRRHALYTTTRYSSGLESHLMNLGQSTTASQPGVTQDFQPITPFIADPWTDRSSAKADSGRLRTTQEILQGVGLGSKPTSDVVKGEEETSKMETDARNRNEALNGIRRSLPFDDLNDSHFDTSVTRDDLNDTTTSRSHALSDDFQLMSSEEERGSPILTGSRSTGFDTSDKSNNSITGSSLNGSALVARAEERREGFERRQEELRRQLLEIQDQKEAIMQRYYTGQQALLQKQEAVKAKLASSVASSQPDPVSDESQQRSQLREKLSFIRSQVKTDDNNDDVQSESVTQFSRQGPESSKSISPSSWSEHLKGFRQSDGSSKLGQIGSSGSDFPMDSYLDEISYRQIKDSSPSPSALQKWASASMPEELKYQNAKQETDSTSSRSTLVRVSKDESTSGSLQTWASVLQSSHSLQPSDKQTSSSSLHEYSSFGAGSAEDRESGSRTPPITSSLGIHQHLPHELSTIIEVDTPTSSSFRGSNFKATASSLSNPSLSHSSTQSLISRWDSDTRVDRFVDLPYTFPTSSSLTAGVGYDLTSGREVLGSEDISGRQAEQHTREKSGISLTETSKAVRSLDFRPSEIEFKERSEGAGSRVVDDGQNDSAKHSPSNNNNNNANALGVSFHSDTMTLEGDEFSLQSQSLPLVEDKDLSLESRSLSPDHLERIQESMQSGQSHTLEERDIINVDSGDEELSSTTMPDLVGMTPIRSPFTDGSCEG